MIRIAICDNEINDLEWMFGQIDVHMHKKYPERECFIRRFHSVYDLMECLENPNLQFDVYFLEINLQILNGIEVGRMIRKNDDYAVIVYTNKSKDFALDSMATAPLQYLVKPVEHEKLIAALDSAVGRVEQTVGKNVLIKRRDGLANVGLHQIEYVEYKDHALAFFLTSGKTITSRIIHESFTWVVENTLTDPRFCKPHASYVVNMDHVLSMNNREFEMQSGALIPISKRVYSSVKQQFIDYMVDQNGASVL